MIPEKRPEPKFEREPIKEPLKAESPEKTTKPQVKEQTEQTAPQVLVSHTDAYVWDRMKGQPKSLDEVDVMVVTERDPNIHRLSLPAEIKEYEGKYTFRWIFKSKRAIDDACDVKGWLLANRLYFPDLPSHLFTANGSIERGDNILAFIPKAKADALRNNNSERAKAQLDSLFNKHKDNPNYYAPSDKSEDSGEKSKVLMI